MLNIANLQPLGRDLKRPECVLCCASGTIYVANWDGGVTAIFRDGTQAEFLARNAPVALRPNGIALQADGAFLIANLGDDGGIWHLQRSGECHPFLLEVEGEAIPPANFVAPDADGGVWITISTRHAPRARAYRRDIADGFIVRVDQHGARIAADGLGYTNECALHPSGKWLYVNETFSRRLSRFALSGGGRLGARETVYEFGEGDFPDGLCFDEDGGIWITSIISNRLIRIATDGSSGAIRRETMLEDVAAGHVEWVEQAYRDNAMDRPHLDRAAGSVLANISSLAFGGADRKTGYLGCLLGENIYTIAMPAKGAQPVHWHWG